MNALRRTILLLAALAVAVASGFYIQSRIAQSESDKRVAAELRLIAKKQKADEEALAAAIRDRRAIIGMTASEVIMAKGQPYIVQSGRGLPDEYREHGGVENWIYQASGGDVNGVLFGSNGLVVYSADVAGKTLRGNVIRQ